MDRQAAGDTVNNQTSFDHDLDSVKGHQSNQEDKTESINRSGSPCLTNIVEPQQLRINDDNHSHASLEDGQNNISQSHEHHIGMQTHQQSSQHNYAINLHSHTVKNLSCCSLKEVPHEQSKSNDSSHCMDKAVEVYHPSQS